MRWTPSSAASSRAIRCGSLITANVNPGLIVATLGYWRQLNKGTVNSISSAEFVNMGHAPTFSDNLVQVESIA